MPKIVGLPRTEAITLLKANKLTPVKQGVKYDLNMPKDYILFQKPDPNAKVKQGRHIYYWVCGGEPLVQVPKVIGKTKIKAAMCGLMEINPMCTICF